MLSKFDLVLDDTLDPRIKRTRQLLVNAYIDLIREKNLPSITIQDITKRAQINRATFYAHFEDKYALSDYVIRAMFRHRLAQGLPNLEYFSLEHLQILIVIVCEFLQDFHSECHPADKQMRPTFETQIQMELYEVILQWMQQLDSLQIIPEVTASIISWAIFGAGMDWNKSPNSLSLPQMATQVYQTLLGGLMSVSQLSTTF